VKLKVSFFSFISLVIILSFIISSCRNTNNVVSSGFLQKRKYNKGFFVNIFPRREKVSTVLHPNIETEVMTENSLSPLSLKGGEFSNVHPSGSGQKHQKIDTTNIYLLASVDNVKQTDNIPCKPSIPEKKNILQKPNNRVVGKIISKLERRLIIPLPLGKDDGKRVMNKDALIGFFCGIATPFLLIVLMALLIGAASSIILDIVGIAMVICAICAFTYSRSGLNQIKHFPEIFKGKGLARAGLILGMIEIAIMLTILLIALIIYLLLK